MILGVVVERRGGGRLMSNVEGNLVDGCFDDFRCGCGEERRGKVDEYEGRGKGMDGWSVRMDGRMKRGWWGRREGWMGGREMGEW